MRPYYDRAGVTLFCGDNRRVIPSLREIEFDAVVTDPPYGLSFMSRDWDHEVPGPSFWKAMGTVMKPGAHLASFGGTRTQHRIAVAIEDAGFEIRDTAMWLHGEGFPKGQDIGKLIDRAAGVDPEVVGYDLERAKQQTGQEDTAAFGSRKANDGAITAPATEAAKAWSGWNTQLKPAYEPIIIARKPMELPVHENVLKHGTGAMNIEATRVGTSKQVPGGTQDSGEKSEITYLGGWGKRDPSDSGMDPNTGRWPANVMMDETVGAMLDAQSGDLGKSSGGNSRFMNKPTDVYGLKGDTPSNGINPGYGDTGGASRFFYCAKASRKERGELNLHPTVKPIALMRYLIRMFVPKGAIILEPFAGSGTTLIAAAMEGVRAVGIEQSPEYCAIIKKRLQLYQDEIREERR